MSLLQEGMEPCRLMEKKRVPDGEGGFITSWQDGPEFMAAIVCDQSLEARAAEKEGLTSLYTVTCAKGAKLDYHDVFKRLEDGKTFRVTSDGDDKTTPERASFQVSQVTAEKWELSARADGQTTVGAGRRPNYEVRRILSPLAMAPSAFGAKGPGCGR